MSERNDISGLLGFIGRDETWRERLQDSISEHLVPALEEFELDHDDLMELLGEQWSGVLWGCGFEDFLGRYYGERNIVDLYLKRRGWKEPVLNRAYFAALRDTPVSLYEVSDVRPGVSMKLRDLISDAEPVTVREKSATGTLKQWDRIAVRVVPERDHHVISGALLPFSVEASDLLFSALRDALNLGKRAALRLTPEQLSGCAPLFTAAWLFVEISRSLDPAPPQLRNSDGDEVMFHDLRFPFASGVTQKKIATRLDKVKSFRPEGPKFWNWIAARKRRGTKPASGIMLESQIDRETVLGTLELKGKALMVSVNSARRAETIKALVTKAVGEILKPPLTSIRTVEQMMAEPRNDRPVAGADEIPAEISRQVTHDYMDQHYREALDTPLPALHGNSPREAARSAEGRAKVVEWLKYLENSSAKHSDGPIAEYDFSWIWAELGLENHRN